MKPKYKEEGISLLVAFGTSVLVLTLALGTQLSIVRSLGRSTTLERSDQFFYAAESGAEAAFFHHNARGAGTDMPTGGVTQQITHAVTAATTEWKILGRQQPVVGLMREHQTIQIPLYWDSATDPTMAPTPTNFPAPVAAGGEDLKIVFYNQLAQPNPNVPGAQNVAQMLWDAYGATDISGFDYGTTNTGDILIDWSIVRKDATNGIQTYTPIGGNDACGSLFVCKSEMTTPGINAQLLTTNTTGSTGRVLPCRTSGGCPTDLSSFFQDANGSEYILTFRPILPFLDQAGTTRIAGIPFSIESMSGTPTSIPKNTYTIDSKVTIDDFEQVVRVEIPERTSIGAFDYVILD